MDLRQPHHLGLTSQQIILLEKEKKRGEEKKKEGCRYFETHQTSWIRKKAHGYMVILNIAHSLKSDVLRKSMKVCYSLVDDKTKTGITMDVVLLSN